MKKSIYILYAIILIIFISSSCKNEKIRFFAGKYTKPGEKGFYIFDLNRKEGKFDLVSVSDAGPNPSYFCISKKNGLIYAGNEFGGINGDGVTTLRYDDKTGEIEKINELAIPGGGPCFISLSPDDDFLFLASYGGGSVAVVKLDDKGIPDRISDTIFYKGEEGEDSRAHMVSFSPAGKMVYLTDLGLDRIVIYSFDFSSGRLHQIPNGIVKLPKGSGPRHFVFSSDGTKMYVINETSSSISVFNVDYNGELKSIQTIKTLSDGFNGKNLCADIHIGKNGQYLYGSNRGENTIVAFRIGSDGTLKLAGRTSCGGDYPRNFVIDPSGKYILIGNQKSGNISLFRIDRKTGIPIQPGKDYKITMPSCLKF